MKQALLLVMLLSGCARVWYRHEQQPDHSYKITTNGNGYTSLEKVMTAATQTASQLCPKGYEQKASIPDDSFKPAYTLIVECKP